MRSGWTVHGSLVNTVSTGEREREREGERERDEVTRSVLHALLSLHSSFTDDYARHQREDRGC